MVSKKKTEKVEPGNHYYVSATGKSTNKGTKNSPWDLNHALSGAKSGIRPGDTCWVGGGTYRSEKDEDFEVTVSGNVTDKITFKAYPGETVILDGSIAAFRIVGNHAWQADAENSADRN